MRASSPFPAPHSYTGEDVVELSAHGSPVVLRAIVRAALARGARLAEPGEFTLRAFLNGRIDLMQAEAVHDLIEAVDAAAGARRLRSAGRHADPRHRRHRRGAVRSDRAARGVDRFPGRGLSLRRAGRAGAVDRRSAGADLALLAGARRGRLIREGLQVAIVGEPNVGKSSLFNALAGASRAIVTDCQARRAISVTETIDIEGLRVTLVDTAGLRDTDDPIEREGVARAAAAGDVADLVLRASRIGRGRRSRREMS